MSTRPFDPMDFDIDAFEQSLPGAYNIPPLPNSDDGMSDVSEVASRSDFFPELANVQAVPMADVEAIPQAILQTDYRDLSTAQIKKMVPYGPILHLLDPDQQKMLLDENETNTLDGRPALVSGVTRRFSIPGNRRRFTITAEGRKVFW